MTTRIPKRTVQVFHDDDGYRVEVSGSERMQTGVFARAKNAERCAFDTAVRLTARDFRPTRVSGPSGSFVVSIDPRHPEAVSA